MKSWEKYMTLLLYWKIIVRIEEKNMIAETVKLGVIGAAVGFIGTSCVVLLAFAFSDGKKKSEEKKDKE